MKNKQLLVSFLIIGGAITFLVIAALCYTGYKVFQVRNKNRKQDLEYRANRRKDFLDELERHAKVTIPGNYERQKAETTQRYEEARDQPGVIWGSVMPPDGYDLGKPLTVTLIYQGSAPFVHQSIVDDQLHFAIPPAPPGEYEILLSGTPLCPGVRLEHIVTTADQPTSKTIIELDNATIEVTVRERYDLGSELVYDAQVLVGKSAGGVFPNLFTFRKGLTGSDGIFVAETLSDGSYVITANTLERSGSVVVSIAKNEYKQVEVTLTHDNF